MVLQARSAEVLHQVETRRAVAVGLAERRRYRRTEEARSAVLTPERLEVRVDAVARRHATRGCHRVRGRHELDAQGSRHDRAALQQKLRALEVLRAHATLRGVGELLRQRIADQTGRVWLALPE